MQVSVYNQSCAYPEPRKLFTNDVVVIRAHQLRRQAPNGRCKDKGRPDVVCQQLSSDLLQGPGTLCPVECSELTSCTESKAERR